MIERIAPENPLTARHVGMMAVLRNGGVCGPIFCAPSQDQFFATTSSNYWGPHGFSQRVGSAASTDIIAVLPMPDLSGLEGE